MTENAVEFEDEFEDTRREATFYIGVEAFDALVEDAPMWTAADWSNLVLAVIRTAQTHTGRLPFVDDEILAALKLAQKEAP